MGEAARQLELRVEQQVGRQAAALVEAKPGEPAPGGLSATDLAELMASFTEVTAKLEGTHAALRSEVTRLKADLKRANEQLERSRRLAALGEMAAGISHEIRNPLGSLRLYAKMLVDDLADRPEQREIASKMGVSVRRLDEVVNDVLAFARETKVRGTWASASDLLESAVEASRGAEAQVGAPVGAARLVVEDGDAEVWCDYGLAHRALVNVVRNAIEAVCDRDDGRGDRERGGEVRLSVRAVRERDDEGDGHEYVVLRVRDDGPGVPPGVIERMFNPFFTTRAAGTGLGLAIVHRIMDAHGGRVSIKNNADAAGGGPGASVELWFPTGAAIAAAGVRGADDAEPSSMGTES